MRITTIGVAIVEIKFLISTYTQKNKINFLFFDSNQWLVINLPNLSLGMSHVIAFVSWRWNTKQFCNKRGFFVGNCPLDD
jgi:hypothetical protein